MQHKYLKISSLLTISSNLASSMCTKMTKTSFKMFKEVMSDLRRGRETDRAMASPNATLTPGIKANEPLLPYMTNIPRDFRRESGCSY